ncbi:alpha-xylosidase [Microbacterium kyungheense]|uniref:alpha-D-xyloside xylohydrolase n=1 Tax=Microbacterium kyungheense TaxID=1263636 RepID=A0A543EUI4_9MICO|nr:alpha-xylosidase [Microbacterium kyungheense]TQM25227.1 alpha-D-xyloside xylohydrolase [Microbacterium kyungheense]
MKFTDGYWLTRPSFSPLYAIEVDDIRVDEAAGTMSVYAPTAAIRERGDTLNRPMLTVVFSAPAPGVVKVRIEHHSGAVHRGPDFEVRPAEGFVPTVRLDDEWGVLEAGSLRVRVARSGPWRVEFLSGDRVLTTSLPRSIGHMTGNGRPHTAIRPSGGDPTWVHQQLTIEPGERVYGLGERFGAFVKNGQTVDTWNADGGTSSEQSYKNVPFYLTSRGYGVFVDNPADVSFEIGSEVNSRVQFSVDGESLDYYVIDGPEPKDVLRRYTELTGRPARVPAWSFGLWLTTSFTASYDEDTVSAFVDGMAERDIPLSVFHYDCFWMREYQWTDFEWDARAFHDPVGQIARMHERDVHVSVWINPYIAQRSALFREAADKGYLLRRTDGGVWQWDMWQAGMALVDFTNPDAADWYVGKLQGLLDQGVDTFKTDFGERIPVEGVVWHDGSDPHRMHNFYAKLYNEVVFRALERHKGVGNAVVFARSATAGSQQFPVHWGGDSDSSFLSMAESLRGGLSLAMSGFGYWSHDIGGFEGTPDPGLFKRWLAFGLLSSHSRLHGSSTVRVPWAFDDEAVDVAREFTKLKMRLMPYLAGAAEQAHTDGTPMMRPMVLEFPGDRSGFDADTQYMLGEALLVAPVFTADGTVEYYVPEGEWTSLLDGSVVDGRRWITETHGYDSVPLRVRPGTVLPFGADDSRPDYDWADGVTLRCFALPDGYDAVTTVPGHDGSAPTSFRVLREGRTITAISDDARAAWALQVGDRIVRGEASTLSLQLDVEEAAR